MRRLTILLGATAVLCGCGDQSDGPGEPAVPRGRYAGIGTFPVNDLWPKLSRTPASADGKAATLADDKQIIVTVDSQTGEVRQCGDLSGHCIAMNPWRGGAAPSPAQLERHAAVVQREAAAAEAAPRVKPRP